MVYSTANAVERQVTLFNTCPKELYRCCIDNPTEKENEFNLLYCEVMENLPFDIYYRKRAKTGRPGIALRDIVSVQLVHIFFRSRTIQETLAMLRNSSVLMDITEMEKVPSAASVSRLSKKVESILDVNEALRSIHSRVPGSDQTENIIIDSTIIEAREKPAPKRERRPYKGIGRGKRPDRNNPEHAEYIAEMDRKKEMQFLQTEGDLDEYREMLNLNSGKCAKKNANGDWKFYIGYKVHLAVNDDDIPIAADFTGANEQDNMLAIPLLREATKFCIFKNALMDAAYHAKKIENFVVGLGGKAIIDGRTYVNQYKTKPKQIMSEEDQETYKKRATIERTNGLLKEKYAFTALCQRGANARLQLKFSVLLLTVFMLARKFAFLQD